MPITHFLPFLLLIVPLLWGIYGYTSTRTSSLKTTSEGKSWVLILNSSLLYALSFNIIFFFQELALALGKRWLGLKAYLYHNNHNWEGEHPMQALAQGYGAITIFILGVVFYFASLNLNKSSSSWRLFILWLSFQGFSQSIPQFISASTEKSTDTGQAFTYLGLPDEVGLLMAVTGIILSLWLGYRFCQMFLSLSDDTDVIKNSEARGIYIRNIVLWPAIIGAVLTIPFRVMPWSRAASPFMLALISIPMILASARRMRLTTVIETSASKKILIAPVVALVVLLLVFQLVLAKGVPF